MGKTRFEKAHLSHPSCVVNSMPYRLTFLIILFSGAVMAAHAEPPDLRAAFSIHPLLEDSVPSGMPYTFHRELKRPHVALVLSGGGARGMAQIGVLRVLEKNGIPVDFIAATSMGAIVGGLYASGYTVAEIDSLARNTPWDDLLSLTGDTKRSELFVDQKIAGDRSFFALRFQGFEPVLPPAVSSGQRLTDFLSAQTLQAPYHPHPSFDDLKIPFRVVATDLVSGNRVILSEGSLAEALRGSSTVPLLFSPIEKDGMELVDGGLVSNIPVDLAWDWGADLVLVVNSTSGLRTQDEMKAPWQTADQIMSIMIKVVNERQLQEADVVLTPEIGRHLSSDFTNMDSLIQAGERAAEENLPAIKALYEEKQAVLEKESENLPQRLNVAHVLFNDENIPDSLKYRIEAALRKRDLPVGKIRRSVDDLYALGDYRDVRAAVVTDSSSATVTFTATPNPPLVSVVFEGVKLVPVADVTSVFAPIMGRPVNAEGTRKALERVLRLYRSRGYSLARIDTMHFEERTGALLVRINEGIIGGIRVEGSLRTRDSFVLREFPLSPGDVFQIDKARQGLTNIGSTTLFDYVYLEVAFSDRHPILTIRLKDRPTQLVRFGIRADNERQLQGLIDVRDENFQGSGMDLGMTIAGGERNVDATIEYKARRLFSWYLALGVGGFFRDMDSYLYADAPQPEANHWLRQRVGEYRDIRYGISVTFGTQLERLGDATAEFLLEDVRTKNLSGADALEEHNRLAIVRLGTLVDTKDQYPFPMKGVGVNLQYEFAFEGFGSTVGYNAVRFVYETYSTWSERFTFHPRLTMGFADKTMPFAQQFRLGGRENFFGVREDDRRGRELVLVNVEWRYFLPVRILFDTYVRMRYDIGTITSVPEEFKFDALRHGLGLELAFDTPVGQAAFGLGKSFFFSGSLPENPLQQGPLEFTFVIGYPL